MKPFIFVLCGNFDEYRAFLAITRIHERYTRYVTHKHHLQGFAPHPRFHVVYYGSYWDNPLLNEAPDQVAAFFEYLTEAWKPVVTIEDSPPPEKSETAPTENTV